MRFLFVVHKNEEKAEQNSVLFHRLTLKERGLRPNGYFPLMRQPLSLRILRDRLKRFEYAKSLHCGADFLHGMTGMPFVCGESPQGAQLPANPIATCKVRIVRCGREEAIAKS